MHSYIHCEANSKRRKMESSTSFSFEMSQQNNNVVKSKYFNWISRLANSTRRRQMGSFCFSFPLKYLNRITTLWSQSTLDWSSRLHFHKDTWQQNNNLVKWSQSTIDPSSRLHFHTDTWPHTRMWLCDWFVLGCCR